jgi:hypothetical protein
MRPLFAVLIATEKQDYGVPRVSKAVRGVANCLAGFAAKNDRGRNFRGHRHRLLSESDSKLPIRVEAFGLTG